MCEVCRKKLVGQIMASSLAQNPSNYSVAELGRISEAIQQEAKDVAADNPQVLPEGDKPLDSTQPPKAQQDAAASSANTTPKPMTPAQVDKAVICSVMCCCNENATKGSADQDLKQSCAHEVFKAADEAMGWKSRYKSEVSWDMGLETGEEPRALMHRNHQGNNTTEPSHYWMGRLQDIPGYKPGKGYVRRPDLLIVEDSAQPPSQENLAMVYEFKFGQDRNSVEQNNAYKEIAGSKKKYKVYRTGGTAQTNEHGCNCKNPAE